MSFSSKTKESLLEELPARDCCKKSLLMGFLTYASVYNREKIKLITEIKQASDTVAQLLRELYGIECNIYVSEKKSSNEDEEATGVINSYKITVSDRRKIALMKNDFPENSPSLYRVNKKVFDDKCGRCRSMFLRGAFIASGTVSRPDSSYHLELSSPYKNLVNDTTELCREAGIVPRVAVRGSSNVIYYKKCDDIADFLAYIGANSASFDYINESIVRENRGIANRAVNCDTANIRKTVTAATDAMEAVEFLENHGYMDKLTGALRDTARLRYDNPQASLAELAEMTEPRVTKSCISHRMKKLTDLYEKYRQEGVE